MDLRQLKYFSVVARLGSFSKAASVLGMTQPALSKQVSNLESTLGKRLLVRNGRGVTLTEVGQRMAIHAVRIMDIVSEAEADITATAGGRLAIGLPFSIAATIATDLVAKVRKAEPDMNIAVIQGRSSYLMECLFSGKIDVAVIFGVTNSPLLETVPLISEELFLMASKPMAARLHKRVPIPLEELATYPLLAPSRSNVVRSIIEKMLQSVNKTPNIVLEIDNMSTMLEMVARGEGFAVVSKLAHSLSVHKADLVPLKIAGPPHWLEICLASSSRGSVSQLHGRVIKLVEETSRSLLQQAAGTCADDSLGPVHTVFASVNRP